MMTSADDVVLTKRITLTQSQGDGDEKEALLITLNRPSKNNCFNTRVCHELATIFHDVANEIERHDAVVRPTDDGSSDDDGRRQRRMRQKNELVAVIFTGAGKSFCAGADLSNPPNPLHQSSDLPHHLRWNPVHQMGRVGVPIIGALSGHVITGGFELALACDILVGDSTTSFRDTHVKFGLAPCWGLSQRLSIRIGPGRARIVSFTAQPVNAVRAYEWGLLDELVDDSLGRAVELANAVAANDPLMVRRYKRAIVEGSNVHHRMGLQRERELGLAHYMEIVGDGQTFEGAKEYITDDGRPRLSESKL